MWRIDKVDMYRKPHIRPTGPADPCSPSAEEQAHIHDIRQSILGLAFRELRRLQLVAMFQRRDDMFADCVSVVVLLPLPKASGKPFFPVEQWQEGVEGKAAREDKRGWNGGGVVRWRAVWAAEVRPDICGKMVEVVFKRFELLPEGRNVVE